MPMKSGYPMKGKYAHKSGVPKKSGVKGSAKKVKTKKSPKR